MARTWIFVISLGTHLSPPPIYTRKNTKRDSVLLIGHRWPVPAEWFENKVIRDKLARMVYKYRVHLDERPTGTWVCRGYQMCGVFFTLLRNQRSLDSGFAVIIIGCAADKVVCHFQGIEPIKHTTMWRYNFLIKAVIFTIVNIPFWGFCLWYYSLLLPSSMLIQVP